MERDCLTLTNDSAQVEPVQRELETILQAADIRMKIVWAINIALGEWIENIIQYAYADDAIHTIGVQVELAPGEVVLRITDDGRPFDPGAFPEMAATPAGTGKTFTSRGIHLIRHLVDRVDYERVGEENVLTLAKRCPIRDEQ
jgi:serine/threonine-protein kinase RsbW